MKSEIIMHITFDDLYKQRQNVTYKKAIFYFALRLKNSFICSIIIYSIDLYDIFLPV